MTSVRIGPLFKHLQQYYLIKSSKVVEIMVNVDIGLFVPSGDYVYDDIVRFPSLINIEGFI